MAQKTTNIDRFSIFDLESEKIRVLEVQNERRTGPEPPRRLPLDVFRTASKPLDAATRWQV
jgi:hypothetical protein